MSFMSWSGPLFQYSSHAEVPSPCHEAIFLAAIATTFRATPNRLVTSSVVHISYHISVSFDIATASDRTSFRQCGLTLCIATQVGVREDFRLKRTVCLHELDGVLVVDIHILPSKSVAIAAVFRLLEVTTLLRWLTITTLAPPPRLLRRSWKSAPCTFTCAIAVLN